MDEVTLWGLERNSANLGIASIDTEEKTCNYTRISETFSQWRLACSPHGHVYVTSVYNGKVLVYDRAGQKEVWEPYGVKYPSRIAVNCDHIVVSDQSSDGEVFVYGINKVFLYRKTIVPVKCKSLFLTEQGLLVGAIAGNQIMKYNMMDKSIVTMGTYGMDDGQFSSSGGVTSYGEIILAADYDNCRIHVWSLDPSFLHFLHFDGTLSQKPRSISVMPRVNKTPLLALNDGNIYTLTP